MATGADNGCSETRLGGNYGKDCAGTGCNKMATGADGKCNGCSETRMPNYGTELDAQALRARCSGRR